MALTAGAEVAEEGIRWLGRNPSRLGDSASRLAGRRHWKLDPPVPGPHASGPHCEKITSPAARPSAHDGPVTLELLRLGLEYLVTKVAVMRATFLVLCISLFFAAATAFMAPVNVIRLRTSNTRMVRSVRSSTMCDASPSDRAAEIKAVLAELAAFRGRIVDDAVAVAKKIKAKPKEVQSALDNNPDVKKIDEAVLLLEAELKQITAA